MSAADQRAKNQAMAAHLIRMGYWHGRRFSTGLSGIPVNEPGSAAYRRRQKNQQIARQDRQKDASDKLARV